MALATLSAKVDSENKKEFERFCEDTGMNVSVCINMFVKDVLRNRRLPFVVTTDSFFDKEHIAMLEKRVDDMNHGRNMHEHDLVEVDECGSHYGDH